MKALFVYYFSLLMALTVQAVLREELAPVAIETEYSIPHEEISQPVENSESSEGNVLYEQAMNIFKDWHGDFYDDDINTAFSHLAMSMNQYNHTLSIEFLAEVSFFANFTVAPNLTLSRECWMKLVQLNQSPKAHFYLSFMEDEGIDGERNPGKSLAHLTISALGGFHLAHMALGYKYFYGIGVEDLCSSSAYHYYQVAEQVANGSEFFTYPGRSYTRVKLMSEDDDMLHFITHDDVLQYYQLTAGADAEVQVILGQVYYFGANGVSANNDLAFHYFSMAAEEDHPIALGYLGMMYLNGEGVLVDYDMALSFFKRGIAHNHAISWNGLGIMYLKGLGLERSNDEALACFNKAAEQNYADAHYWISQIYKNRSGLFKAKHLQHLQIAALNSHVKAVFDLGKAKLSELSLLDMIGINGCSEARKYFKMVSERGLGYHVQDAYKDYIEGYELKALTKYRLAAFIGFDCAQSNIAFILEKENTAESYSKALPYLIRAANQGDLMARTKSGDYYYYGLGVPIDYAMAARLYTIAEQKSHHQAAFNLGYCHEYGLGVPKDFKMARRYYERTLEFNSKASIPVTMALWKLNFKERFEKGLFSFFYSTKDSDAVEKNFPPDGKMESEKSSKSGPSSAYNSSFWSFSFLNGWWSYWRTLWGYLQRTILTVILILTAVHYLRNLWRIWQMGGAIDNHIENNFGNDGQRRLPQEANDRERRTDNRPSNRKTSPLLGNNNVRQRILEPSTSKGHVENDTSDQNSHANNRSGKPLSKFYASSGTDGNDQTPVKVSNDDGQHTFSDPNP